MDGDTGDEYAQREQHSHVPPHSLMHESPPPTFSPHVHFSPAHTTHHFPDSFEGTSLGQIGTSAGQQSTERYDYYAFRNEIANLRQEVQAHNDIEAKCDNLLCFIHQHQLDQIEHIQVMQASRPP